MRKQQIERFVRRLEDLRDGKEAAASADSEPPTKPGPDRAAMATLRRALSGEERDTLPTYRYLGWYLPPHPKEQERCILVAALFADHQGSTTRGTMGEHLAALIRADDQKQAAVERRFSQLLTAHPDDLPIHLRQVINLLKTAGIPINWQRLLRDVLYWEKDGERIRQKWAYDFWGPDVAPPSSPVRDDSSQGNADSLEANY
jgi:CRISPR system Cascade subunit CasB